jgi:hypothetical protein
VVIARSIASNISDLVAENGRWGREDSGRLILPPRNASARFCSKPLQLGPRWELSVGRELLVVVQNPRFEPVVKHSHVFLAEYLSNEIGSVLYPLKPLLVAWRQAAHRLCLISAWAR